MGTWTLDHPDKLTFDEVRRVVVRTVEGMVSVVGSDDRPTLELSELSRIDRRSARSSERSRRPCRSSARTRRDVGRRRPSPRLPPRP